MNISTERKDNNQVEITVEIPEDNFDQSLQKAYKIVVKKLNIPGFRKGKAPRRVVENMYGREMLYEDALQDAVPKAYYEALNEKKEEFIAVSEPEYDIVQIEKGKPVIFKATFDVKPEVKLGQYKGIELEKENTEVTAEDIDAELKKMQERYAKLVVVEEDVIEGDVLTIDFEGKVDGQPFEGGKSENYSIEVGSKTFIPGFEEQMIGMKVGETKDIEVTFPEDYGSEELAGKDAVFTVTVNEAKRKEFAELDDEFAKDVSEFETLQELREDVENKLKEAAKIKDDNKLKASAIENVVKNAEVDIPQSMIETQVNGMIQDFSYRLAQQGISMEYYLKATDSDIEGIKDKYRTGAEASVRNDLVLEAIAEAEDIKAEQEDIDKEINKTAEQYKQKPEQIKEVLEKQGQIASFVFGIRIEKAVDLIISEAKYL